MGQISVWGGLVSVVDNVKVHFVLGQIGVLFRGVASFQGVKTYMLLFGCVLNDAPLL